MEYGITIKEWADTLNNALKDNPQLADYKIDNFNIIHIQHNGCYSISLYAAGDYGQTCVITKCLKPKEELVIDE